MEWNTPVETTYFKVLVAACMIEETTGAAACFRSGCRMVATRADGLTDTPRRTHRRPGGTRLPAAAGPDAGDRRRVDPWWVRAAWPSASTT